MKNLTIIICLILVGVSAKAQDMWEANPKVIPNVIGGVDTVKYLSGRVSYAYVSKTANSSYQFKISFHRPDGSILSSRDLTQSSYVENLINGGMAEQTAIATAEYVWTHTILDLMGGDLEAKETAVIVLLNVYGYTLKE